MKHDSLGVYRPLPLTPLPPSLALLLRRLVALLSFRLRPGHVRLLLMKLYPWSVKSLAICSFS